jgi:ParB family chromosome partitioning protein
MKFTKAEIDAIIEASPRTFVPFNKLVLSQDYQARAGGSTPKMSIAELAASIKECGVLQNLVVVQGARGRYEVCAGGRRLDALTLLVGNGDLADNYPVPVLIVPADRALIASLSENCFHIPMHPADEFAAFAKLIGQGKSVEDVAAAFGVTPLVVKRRMKLATVSPKLMALFREDQIGLDCLMVLASVDDHQKQEQTWAALPSWNRRPDYLRQLLTQGEIESDRDAVAKYVTLKAYEKAGGALRRDLFSDDDKKVYLLDAALLEKLATDKLQKRAKQIAAEGWKWVDVRVRYAFDEYVKYGELRKTKRQPDAEEAAALEDLDGRIAALHAQMETLADEDGDEETFYQLEGEAEGLEEQRKALDETLSVWPADLMAQAGCVVHVGHNGAVAVKYGLIRPDDRSDMVQAARQAAENGTDDHWCRCRRPRPARCIPRSWCVASPPTGSPPSRPNCSTAPTWRWPRSLHIWRRRFSGATTSTIAARRTSSPSARPTANPNCDPPPRTWRPVPPGRSFRPSAPPGPSGCRRTWRKSSRGCSPRSRRRCCTC